MILRQWLCLLLSLQYTEQFHSLLRLSPDLTESLQALFPIPSHQFVHTPGWDYISVLWPRNILKWHNIEPKHRKLINQRSSFLIEMQNQISFLSDWSGSLLAILPSNIRGRGRKESRIFCHFFLLFPFNISHLAKK